MGDPFNRTRYFPTARSSGTENSRSYSCSGFNYREMELFLTQMDRFSLNMEFSEYCHELYMHVLVDSAQRVSSRVNFSTLEVQTSGETLLENDLI